MLIDVSPNPMDTRTLIQFLDTIESHFFQLPKYIVADAGYGSEANYLDIIENRGRTPLITYSNYLKEQKENLKKFDSTQQTGNIMKERLLRLANRTKTHLSILLPSYGSL